MQTGNGAALAPTAACDPKLTFGPHTENSACVTLLVDRQSGYNQVDEMRFAPLRLGALALLAFCLAGCGKSESYRYKLTVEVNTPEGVKRTSNVVEVQFSSVSVPARGVMHELNGEALYLDLGGGRRPLIVSNREPASSALWQRCALVARRRAKRKPTVRALRCPTKGR